MIPALLPFLNAPPAAVSGILPPTNAPNQWVSPSLRRGDEVIYMSGPDGVYIYRRRPAFDPVGFIFVEANVTTAGPALDANQNLYVVDYRDAPSDSVVDEYSHSAHRFKLVRQFTGADYGSVVAVGPDGDVYVVGIEGEVLEYAASGGAPIRALYSRRQYNVPIGVAIDGQSDVFVSYQFQPSGLGMEHAISGSDSGCHRRSGEVAEFAPHSTRGHCVNSTPETGEPSGLAFDAGGNLLVANVDRKGGEITVLSPPSWAVSRVIRTTQPPASLAFGAPNHLYYLNQNDHVVETTYPDGDVTGAWWLRQPWAAGIALGRW